MLRVLFVCTANICRSPIAQGLLEQHLEESGERGAWEVSSAGTWTEEDRRVNRTVQRLMKERGIDLSGHRTREVDEEMLAASDLVLTMTSGQQEALTVEFPEQAGKVRLFSELDGEMKDIQDPVGRGEEAYQETLEAVEGYVQGAGEKLRRMLTVEG